MLTNTGVVSPNSTQLRIYPSFSEIRQEYNNTPKVCSLSFFLLD